MLTSKGKIIVIPCTLGEESNHKLFPIYNSNLILKLTHFVVENEKTARKFIKSLLPEKSQQELTIFTFDKHNNHSVSNEIINLLLKGIDFGIISEAGMPGIADPGSSLIIEAHKNNIKIETLIGPSSIFLALVSSGLNGQKFMFHGYLPKDKIELKKEIASIQNLSLKDKSAHIFMETPYRNNQLLDNVLALCNSSFLLCIACEITLENEFIKTQSINDWKKNKPDLNKKPTIFILQA